MHNVFFEINLLIFCKVLFSIKNKNYFFLDKNCKKSRFILILKKVKKNCSFVEFEAAKIYKNSQNIHFHVDKLTNLFTKIILRNLFKNHLIRKANANFYNNELRLIISKYLYLEINSSVLKIEIVKYFFQDIKFFHLNLNDLTIKKFLEKKYSIKILNIRSLNVQYYQNIINYRIFRFINTIFCFFLKDKKIKIRPEIFFDTESNINFNKSYRSDFFFINSKIRKIIFSNYKETKIFRKNNTRIINTKKLLFYKPDKHILEKIDYMFENISKDLNSKKNLNGLMCHLNHVKLQAKKISPILTHNNINYVISYSSSNILSISLSILRKFFNHKVISYQYSFIKEPNPIMSTSADYMFIFSKYFIDKYSNFYSKPKKILISGYLYSSLIKKFKKDIKKYKNKFRLNNKFIISYFDENADDSNWSLSTIEEMKVKYKELAKFVLDNKDIIVIIKTQFLKNIPTIMFPDDMQIFKAVNSGRFIEFNHLSTKNIIKKKIYFKNLSFRNIIMPMTASLMSDITISEKYGATTSIETAILGKRNIFINDKKFKTNLDKYFKKNIEFSSLKHALNRILNFKNKKHQRRRDRLGNWDIIMKKKLQISNDLKNNFKQKINNIINY